MDSCITSPWNWLLFAGDRANSPRTPVLQVNNVYGIYKAVQNGIGIGFLPEYVSFEGGNLVQVLPEIEGPTIDLYFVYAEEQRNSKRIVVLRDYLLRKIKEGR